MTKTKNRLGTVKIEWEHKRNSCSYYGIANNMEVFRISRVKGLPKPFLLGNNLPIRKDVMHPLIESYSSLTKAKQKAQEILDDFVWSVLDKEVMGK